MNTDSALLLVIAEQRQAIAQRDEAIAELRARLEPESPAAQ